MSQSSEPFDPYHQWLGIPPEEQPPNHYRLLGIQLFEVTREVIQHAADRQMVHLRTLQNGPRAAQSQKLLNEVAAAKLCLLSPAKKADYDAQLAGPHEEGSEIAPPLPSDPAAASSVSIVLGKPSAGVGPSPSRRTSRVGRSYRRSGTLSWLLAGAAVLVTALIGWHWYEDRYARESLVLVLPEWVRRDASVEIDGRPLDLLHDPVASDAEAIELALPRGVHRIQVLRPNCQPIDETIELVAGVPTRLELTFNRVPGPKPRPPSTKLSVGWIVLRWPLPARTGASLQVDGRAVDLTGRSETVNFRRGSGAHSLRIVLANGQSLDRSFTLAPGERWELDVAGELSLTGPRIVLAWPAADRDGARLEIDGQPREIAAVAAGVDTARVTVGVSPGSHTVRIVRPGFEDFRAELANVQSEEQVAVTWVKIRPPRPAEDEMRRLREEFRKKYRQYEEYQKWAAEKDAAKQPVLLENLLVKLETDAGTLPDQSAEQWAAVDEALHMALDGQDFDRAHNVLIGPVGNPLFAPSERRLWEDRIWQAALASDRADALADYLILRKSAGLALTDEEQAVVVQRLSEAAKGGADFAKIVARVEELQEQAILTSDAATRTHVAVYLQAAEGPFATADQALDLCERILKFVPALFESGLDDAPQHVDKLVDAVAKIRSELLRKAGGSEEVRRRLGKVEEDRKDVRDWLNQFGQVREARKTIADGQGSPTDRKLMAFWLLQLGHYAAALPHLRETQDDALVRIGRPLPATAKDLALLADEVDHESRKRGYPAKHAEALRGYVRHLRKMAFDKNDGSLEPTERIDLQSKLDAG